MLRKVQKPNGWAIGPANRAIQTLSGLALALFLAISATGAMAQDGHAARNSMDSSAPAGYHAEMQAQMKMMNEGMTSGTMTGDPDLDFAMMMIPHHQGAIDMAKIQLKYGKDEKLRKMAQMIIDAQAKEIKELKERINDLQKNGSASGTMPASPGSGSSMKMDK